MSRAISTFSNYNVTTTIPNKNHINNAKKKEEAKPAEPAKPSEEVLLLREIRDSLSSGNS